jgi:peptidylprolyl isomerase
MPQAKEGDRVKLHFTGKLEDGTVFDSTEDCDSDDCGCEEGPVEFVIGEGDLVPGLEQAVIGMSPGEAKTVRLIPELAFGERDEELLWEIDRRELPADLAPEVGETLEITDDNGESFPVTVADVSETTVTLDANHPLAGMDLSFDLQLIEIL